MRPSWRAHWLAQLTTISAVIGPSVVCTPVTLPSLVSTAVTRVFSKIRTPPVRAPLASAWVISAGLALPSPPRHTAPPPSAGRVVGDLSPASLGAPAAPPAPLPTALAARRRRRTTRPPAPA